MVSLESMVSWGIMVYLEAMALWEGMVYCGKLCKFRYCGKLWYRGKLI